MKTSTHSLILAASKDKAFDFLARIENLPRWATLFCRELKRDGAGRWKVVTPQGEIYFRLDADRASGVIDMYGGPNLEAMAHWPTRVVAVGEDAAVFLFTAFQYPGMSDEDFAAQCAGLEAEFPHIKAHVEGAGGAASGDSKIGSG